jgi:hypothetical protein
MREDQSKGDIMDIELDKDLALKGATGTALVLGFVAYKQYRKAKQMQKIANKMVETTTMFGRANIEFADELMENKDPEQALADWQVKLEFIGMTMDII